MVFEKIVAPTPRELFVGQIVDMIMSGKLKPGDKLPPERELSEQMGVNRSLVHGGMEELQRMGFVNILPRRGNFVADFAEEGNFNTLLAIANYGGEEYDGNMNISLVEMRNAVVGGAVIRLGKAGTPQDFEHLRQVLEEHRKMAGDDIEKTAECMMQFNLELAKTSGNLIFPIIMNSFTKAHLFWKRCVQHWGVETIFAQEEKMIELIERGKGHEAAVYIENIFEAYMSDHGMTR